mgnify:CR=1 FL=1
MLEQLEAIRERYEEVSQQMTMPEIVSDMTKFTRLSKEYKDLEKIVNQLKVYKNVLSNIEGAKDIIANEKDEDMRDLAKEELDELLPKRDELEAILKEMTVFFSDDFSVDEEEIWNEYHEALFRKGIPTVFETPNQGKFMGIIMEVNREGKLCVQLEDDSIQIFDLKEVKMYY